MIGFLSVRIQSISSLLYLLGPQDLPSKACQPEMPTTAMVIISWQGRHKGAKNRAEGAFFDFLAQGLGEHDGVWHDAILRVHAPDLHVLLWLPFALPAFIAECDRGVFPMQVTPWMNKLADQAPGSCCLPKLFKFSVSSYGIAAMIQKRILFPFRPHCFQ